MKLKKIAVVTGVLGAMAASSYSFGAGYARDTYYFMDAGRTNVVGEKYTDCVGNVSMWGSVSIYTRTYSKICTIEP